MATQAVFSLKGKPLNVYGLTKKIVYENEEFNLLQAALLDQTAQMGARPFPYLLHRAHEVAVVHPEEKDQLENMIPAELRRQGADVGEQSYKQSAKELPGRMRME